MSNGDSPNLQPDLCRQRQQRVCGALADLPADAAVLIRPEHVQYLTGFRPGVWHTAAVRLRADGHCLLVAPNEPPDGAAVNEVVTFEANWHGTLRQNQPATAATALAGAGKAGERLAVEGTAFPPAFREALGVHSPADIEPALLQMRRRKDADELSVLKHAISCTEMMYAKAREIIEPGITEIEVFNQLHATAVATAGEPLTGFGNDYRCNAPGGGPRPRAAQAGELYILDLGPGYRGYFADNCRAFSVDGRPTDEQLAAHAAIVRVLEMVEATIKPGVRCRDVFDKAQAMLDEHRAGAFDHHLGHGIGLFPHEAPHLNPRWDDVFAEGEVFTAEPGLYWPGLRAGIRLEENYLVTANGVEMLTAFPLEL
jgi:Xaa-Pro aminopeptidase